MDAMSSGKRENFIIKPTPVSTLQSPASPRDQGCCCCCRSRLASNKSESVYPQIRRIQGRGKAGSGVSADPLLKSSFLPFPLVNFQGVWAKPSHHRSKHFDAVSIQPNSLISIRWSLTHWEREREMTMRE